LRKTLVEPATVPNGADEETVDEEFEHSVLSLTGTVPATQVAQTAANVAANVLNESGVIVEYHAPRLVVQEKL